MVRLLVVVVFAMTIAACDDGGKSSPVAGYMNDPSAIKRGKQVFAGTCGAYCHKMIAGQGGIPYLFDCTWIHGGSDEEIFHTIQRGVPGTQMVGFAEVLPEGNDDIWKIIAYLRSAATCSE